MVCHFSHYFKPDLYYIHCSISYLFRACANTNMCPGKLMKNIFVTIRFRYPFSPVYYCSMDLKRRLDYFLISQFYLNLAGQCDNWRMVVKFGNASYVLYLVHWPVITLYKYALDIKVLDHIGVQLVIRWISKYFLGVLVCLGNSIIISIILHELVERQLLGRTKTLICMVISLYAATLIVISIEPTTSITTSGAYQWLLGIYLGIV